VYIKYLLATPPDMVKDSRLKTTPLTLNEHFPTWLKFKLQLLLNYGSILLAYLECLVH